MLTEEIDNLANKDYLCWEEVILMADMQHLLSKISLSQVRTCFIKLYKVSRGILL